MSANSDNSPHKLDISSINLEYSVFWNFKLNRLFSIRSEFNTHFESFLSYREYCKISLINLINIILSSKSFNLVLVSMLINPSTNCNIN